MLLIFSTPVLIRHLWQLKTVVFLHWCLICAALLNLAIWVAQQPIGVLLFIATKTKEPRQAQLVAFFQKQIL